MDHIKQRFQIRQAYIGSTFYSITVFLVLCVILSTQAFTLYAIQIENNAKALATQLGKQRTRALLILMDMNQINDNVQDQTSPRHDLITTLADWERTQRAAYVGDDTIGIPSKLPLDVKTHIYETRDVFAFLDVAANDVIQQLKNPAPDIRMDVKAFSYYVPEYQKQFLAIYTLLTANADDLHRQFQETEFVLCYIMVFSVCVEFFFVCLPMNQKRLDLSIKKIMSKE